MTAAAIGEVASSLVTWGLVVLGWAIVADQQRAEERRRYAMSKIDALKARIVELENIGISFHTVAFDEGKHVTIVRELHRVALELRYLRFSGAFSEEWVRLMIDLRQAITRRNFDQSAYTVHALSSDLVKNITAAGNAMAEFLLSSQLKTFGKQRTLFASLKSIFRTTYKG